MAAPQIALQLYTIRDVFKDGIEQALAAVADIGYSHVELAGLHGKTPAEFKQYVEDGKIHYFIGGGGMGGGNASSGTSSQISEWVQENFKEVTVGSATFYDLTQPTSS